MSGLIASLAEPCSKYLDKGIGIINFWDLETVRTSFEDASKNQIPPIQNILGYDNVQTHLIPSYDTANKLLDLLSTPAFFPTGFSRTFLPFPFCGV